jgi:hypothetical protein
MKGRSHDYWAAVESGSETRNNEKSRRLVDPRLGWIYLQSVDAFAALVPFSDSVLTLCFLRADEAAGRCAPVRDLRPCSQRVREN